jgi:hypothetical protein
MSSEAPTLVPSYINSWMQAPELMLWLLADESSLLAVPSYISKQPCSFGIITSPKLRLIV